MRLSVTQDGRVPRSVEAVGESYVLGRDESCDLTLDDNEASRQHLRLKMLADGTAEVVDLGSRNGTFVNDRKIDGPTRVRRGDVIRIGQTRVTVEPAAGAPATKLAATPPPAPTPSPMREPAAGSSSPSAVKRTQSAIHRAVVQR
ncbi:MAG TPA: FHA domain-containing protein, partial [Solirubrobacterales bacterium]|nr:FHA domain-containing protein [Solirubrobacterales bacterium]